MLLSSGGGWWSNDVVGAARVTDLPKSRCHVRRVRDAVPATMIAIWLGEVVSGSRQYREQQGAGERGEHALTHHTDDRGDQGAYHARKH